jgi:hypothetical protein
MEFSHQQRICFTKKRWIKLNQQTLEFNQEKTDVTNLTAVEILFNAAHVCIYMQMVISPTKHERFDQHKNIGLTCDL